MRWPVSAVLIALAFSSVSSPLGCSCVGGLEATGKGTIEAIEAQDAEKVASYFIEELRDKVIFDMEVVFAIVDDIKISSVKWEVLTETESKSEVDIEVDWKATAADQTKSGHAREIVPLEKVGGEWLINDFSPFEWLVEEITSFGLN